MSSRVNLNDIEIIGRFRGIYCIDCALLQLQKMKFIHWATAVWFENYFLNLFLEFHLIYLRIEASIGSHWIILLWRREQLLPSSGCCNSFFWRWKRWWLALVIVTEIILHFCYFCVILICWRELIKSLKYLVSERCLHCFCNVRVCLMRLMLLLVNHLIRRIIRFIKESCKSLSWRRILEFIISKNRINWISFQFDLL